MTNQLFGMCAALGAMLGVAAHAAAAPAAAYRLDELSGSTATDSAGTNDGSLINASGVTQAVSGVFGTAYEFDGTGGGVNLGTDPAVRPADDFTITFWFNVQTLDSFDRLLESMDGTAPTSQGFRVDLGGDGNDARVLVRDGTGAGNFLTHNDSVVADTWYFGAFRFDKDATNGVQFTILDAAAAPSASNINASTIAQNANVGAISYEAGRPTVLAVENSTGPAGNALDGRLDDVAFYSSVLTSDEVNFVRRFGAQTAIPTIGWDAADPDTAGASSWESNIGTATTASLSAGDSTLPTVANVAGTMFRIPKAYQFFGGTSSASLSPLFPNRNQNATFEIWARPTDLTGQEILFEAGGDASGFSILLDGDQLKLRLDQENTNDLNGASFLQASHTLTSTDIADFMQIIARIDLDNDTIELLLNGQSVGSATTPSAGNDGNISSWAGGNEAAIGSANGYNPDQVGGDDGTDLEVYRALEGEIGVVRFYSDLLSNDQLIDNYNAMLIPEPASMTLLLIGGWAMLRRRQ